MSPEREAAIKKAILNEAWGTNSFGLDVIRELLAEIDNQRIQLGDAHLEIGALKEKLAVAIKALECPLSKFQEVALAKIRGDK